MCTGTDVRPGDLVSNILPRVVGCGFELVGGVKGEAGVRIANPLIEREWWVTIRVNGYNLTSSTETDASIRCLNDIGKKSR